MKTFFVYAFIVASLFPPAGFLCVEASGEVQMEFGYSACRATDSPEPEMCSGEPDDCGGCRDLAISVSSISAKRLVLVAPALAPAPVSSFPEFTLVARPVAYAASAMIPAQSRLRQLSSIVIRC